MIRVHPVSGQGDEPLERFNPPYEIGIFAVNFGSTELKLFNGPA